MSNRVDYLSNEWINAVAEGISQSSEIAAVARNNSVAVTQIITGTPRGDVTYHLESRDGKISFASGAAATSDIAFTQDWQTAVGVATGKINAQEAIINLKDNDAARLSIAGISLVILVISIMFSRRKTVSMVAA